MKKIVILIVLVGIVFGGAYTIKVRINEQKKIKPFQRHAFHVQKGIVTSKTYEVYKRYFGTVKSMKESTLKAQVQGIVSKVLKHEGEYVTKGEIVITIDELSGNRLRLEDSEKNIQSQIRNTNTIISNINDFFKRDSLLYKERAISLEQLQHTENLLKEAESRRNALQIQLSDIQTQLSYFLIKSPYSGRINSLHIDEGDILFPGNSILTMENTLHYKILVTVPGELLNSIQTKSKAIVYFNNKNIPSFVTRVYPSTNYGKGTVEVDMGDNPYSIPTGTYLETDIKVAHYDNALIVPEKSLLRQDKKSFIFKIHKNKVFPTDVDVVTVHKGLAVVKGDLQPGDDVAVASESILLRLNKDTNVITESNNGKNTKSVN